MIVDRMHDSSTSLRTPSWLYRLRRFLRVRRVVVDGLRLIAYRSDIPKHVSQLLVRGDYEAPERRAVSELLERGDRVLEIGSCVGVVALTAARIIGAENIISFEPNPAAARVARENFALNGLSVELTNAAVGAVDGSLELRVAPDSWLGASGRRQFPGQVIAIPMRSIAAIVDEFRPSVLVMDTEGMEEELLQACPLAGLRGVVVEVHSDVIGMDGIERIANRLSEAGFVRSDSLSMLNTETWIRDGVGRQEISVQG